VVDIESMRSIVATGLKEYLGCDVVRSNQNEDMPDYPYVSYTITTLASANNGTYGEWEDGIARKGVISTWSITALSDDAVESMTLAQKAREWLDYAGSAYLNDNDVIVQSVTNITNRDNVISAEYEYRNGFECDFWCNETVNMPEDQGQIESADINVQQEGYDGIIAEITNSGMNIEGNSIEAYIQNQGLIVKG
jgi:hypothetical protein